LGRVLSAMVSCMVVIYAEESSILLLPSYQGFRGLVNTPNALVLPEGEIEIMYSNQIENLTPNSLVDFREDKEEENYFINMGIVPNLDISLRYSYGTYTNLDRTFMSDRIVSLKYQLPFIPQRFLSMAVGMQDVNAHSNYLSSQYIVLSKTVANVRGSLGYAHGEEEAALDGPFGSMEYQPLSWLQLGAEYDTREWNGVLKANYQTTLGNNPTNLGVMAKSSLDYDDVYIGVYANSNFNHPSTNKAWDEFYVSEDRWKPTLTFEPDFILVDGSEYGHMDYTVALNSELAFRPFKHTIISGQYNVPLAMTDNFDEGGIFSYRNRHKTTPNVDQVLLSQYLILDTAYPWVNLLQLGRFDNELEGVSVESALSTSDGKHRVTMKYASLEDGLYEVMDRYHEEQREEKLLSYQYHLLSLQSNIRLTGGEFLYGDEGVMLGFKRYFSNLSLGFDVAYTDHEYKGVNNVARFTLTMPFGTTEHYRSDFLDIQTGNINYVRRKTLATESGTNYAQPLHLTEISNHFTLENYFMDQEKF